MDENEESEEEMYEVMNESDRDANCGNVCYEEVEIAARKLKRGKSAGLDEVCVEMIKEGGRSMLLWLVRLFSVCWREGKVPQDWQDACLVPIYKGKGDKRECTNYRGISLLSVVGKLYGRVLIGRVKRVTEKNIGEEQGGFREGRGCVDQVFTLRMVAEKYREKKKDLFLCFMDLEKAYDRVCRKKLWSVLRSYGVGMNLMDDIRAFYKNCRSCVRVRREMIEFFDVRVGFRQGCVMSPWLFNMFMDSVIVGMDRDGRGASLSAPEGRGEMNVLLYADDAVLMADSGEKLEKNLVREFENECVSKCLKINPAKSKVMWMKNERKEEQTIGNG